MKNRLIFRKRRAVSEVIGTMLILVVTVAGAVFISNALHQGFFAVDQTSSGPGALESSIWLTGYDTRDSAELSGVPTLSNNFDQQLCTITCDGPSNEHKAPISGGTDFIVLHVKNNNLNSVFLHSVQIRNEGHTWDSATALVNFDVPLGTQTAGEFPKDGQFSIIPLSNNLPIQQRGTNELQGDEEVRLVIKLSDQIPQDIAMWDSLRVLVNFGGSQPAEFIILSGDAKW